MGNGGGVNTSMDTPRGVSCLLDKSPAHAAVGAAAVVGIRVELVEEIVGEDVRLNSAVCTIDRHETGLMIDDQQVFNRPPSEELQGPRPPLRKDGFFGGDGSIESVVVVGRV